jgi:hypothetical protein
MVNKESIAVVAAVVGVIAVIAGAATVVKKRK